MEFLDNKTKNLSVAPETSNKWRYLEYLSATGMKRKIKRIVLMNFSHIQRSKYLYLVVIKLQLRGSRSKFLHLLYLSLFNISIKTFFLVIVKDSFINLWRLLISVLLILPTALSLVSSFSLSHPFSYFFISLTWKELQRKRATSPVEINKDSEVYHLLLSLSGSPSPDFKLGRDGGNDR